MDKVLNALKSQPQLSLPDAPYVLRHSGRLWPLGRYLRRRIREGLGRSSDTPGNVLEQYREEMQRVFQDAIDNQTPEESRIQKAIFGRKRWKKIYVDQNKQKILNIKARFELRQGEKKL